MSNVKFNDFVNYVWSFYGPGEIYGKFFNENLTMAELVHAARFRSTSPNFEADSIDREIVRDLILVNRGQAMGPFGLGLVKDAK